MLRWILALGFFFGHLNATLPEKPEDWDSWGFHQKVKWRGKNLDPRINYGFLVDKLRIKEYVSPFVKVAEVFYSTNQSNSINLEKLPSTFVMKSNHGWNQNLFVKDGILVGGRKRDANFQKKPATDLFLQAKAKEWLNHVHAKGKENQYSLVKPLIFFEEHLGDDLLEYQFFCYYGVAKYIQTPRKLYEKNSFFTIYDRDWNYLQVKLGHYPMGEKEPKPPQLEEMLLIAETLSKKIDFVRLDLFLVDGEIFFGEFTFTPTGGSSTYSPLSFEKMLGNLWEYPAEGAFL